MRPQVRDDEPGNDHRCQCECSSHYSLPPDPSPAAAPLSPAVAAAAFPCAASAWLICPPSPAGSTLRNAATSRPTSPASTSDSALGTHSLTSAPARNRPVTPRNT